MFYLVFFFFFPPTCLSPVCVIIILIIILVIIILIIIHYYIILLAAAADTYTSRRYRLELLSRLQKRDIDVAEALLLSPPPPPPQPRPAPPPPLRHPSRRALPRQTALERAAASARASIPLSRRQRRILRRHPPSPTPTPEPSATPLPAPLPPESSPPTPPPTPTPPAQPRPKVTKKFSLLPMATFKNQFVHFEKVRPDAKFVPCTADPGPGGHRSDGQLHRSSGGQVLCRRLCGGYRQEEERGGQADHDGDVAPRDFQTGILTFGCGPEKQDVDLRRLFHGKCRA